MVALLQSGRAVFGVSVGSLWHQIKEALEHEEYVTFDEDAGIDRHHRANDHIAAIRMRKKLESRRKSPRSSLIAYNWYDSARNVRTI